MSDVPVCGMLEQREMRVLGKSWSAGLAHHSRHGQSTSAWSQHTWATLTLLLYPNVVKIDSL